ncbi:MAG: glycosyltransferase family 4 protein [Bacteroidia bacterium]|nr:glycosyltransferase family 4 protein [Bacteroidia bacterium]
MTVYERREMSANDLTDLAERLNPDLIYVTGWMDKAYLKVAQRMRKRGVRVICGLDNHWRGDLRQRMACLFSPFLLKNKFSHIWVPGLFQFEFARRLGFSRENVLTGMYSADTADFWRAFLKFRSQKSESYPCTLLYVGRLVEVKGVGDLLEVFRSANEETGGRWKLKIVGTGPLKGQFQEGNGISFHDFVQPEQLPELAGGAGAFILPSHFEPWGVVLHEFAAAGLPLLASEACGAATAFLRPGYNGMKFQAGNKASLRKALLQLMQSNADQLLSMGERSHELSRQITTQSWAATLHQMAKGED